MARQAHRNYVELMFFGIAKMMVPLDSRLGAADAPQISGGRHLASSNSMANCVISPESLWVILVIAAFIFSARLGMVVGFSIRFALVGLFVAFGFCRCTDFASIRKSFRPVTILVKLRNRFKFLANRTLSVCNGFRHNQFLSNWLSFRAICGQHRRWLASFYGTIPQIST